MSIISLLPPLDNLFRIYLTSDVYSFKDSSLSGKQKIKFLNKFDHDGLLIINYTYEQNEGEDGDDALFFIVDEKIVAKTSSKTNYGGKGPYPISGAVLFPIGKGQEIFLESRNSSIKTLSGFGWSYTFFKL